ncbi:hypothetical protein HSRCO_1281 [Halanaeroarchaeum sp. HSR-CO]|nr:hypothetical protein HSRCO_1281 [Halanaeroarchaeum sp. HSR-CO]
MVSDLDSCIRLFTSVDSLQEMTIGRRNSVGRARTFHYALDTVDGMIDRDLAVSIRTAMKESDVH